LEAARGEEKIDPVIVAAELVTERGEKAGTHRRQEIIWRELAVDPALGHRARDHVMRSEGHDRHRAAGGR
jgi:ABC-type tungstate transport system permease subunit